MENQYYSPEFVLNLDKKVRDIIRKKMSELGENPDQILILEEDFTEEELAFFAYSQKLQYVESGGLLN